MKTLGSEVAKTDEPPEAKGPQEVLSATTFATFGLYIKGLREIFRAHDADGNGFITALELQGTLGHFCIWRIFSTLEY